jgi:TonB family protein
VLILAAAAFAGYRYRAPLQEEWAALVQKIQARNTNTNTSTSLPSTQSASQNSTPEDASAGQAQQDQTSPPQQAPQRAITSPARGSHTPTLATDSVGTRRSIADRIAAAQTPQSQPDGISSADLAGAVRVASAAMEARLVDSRVPAYPDNAKIQGVEGSVVMQVIISRDGTMKRVHVLQGDSRLRNAATEAVYKWRYRPYLLNGQPVDVATTITVDFDLDR